MRLFGIGFAPTAALQCRFVGVSGEAETSVPYSDCTCDNGCRAFRCAAAVWLAHDQVAARRALPHLPSTMMSRDLGVT